jgi:hypothetical protein
VAPVEEFSAVSVPVAEEEEGMDAIELEFKGKTYYIDPESKKVYEKSGDDYEHLGYVGSGPFKGMVLPDDE